MDKCKSLVFVRQHGICFFEGLTLSNQSIKTGPFWLVNFWAPVRLSFERNNFYTVWEIQKIYVCACCERR